jgi:hypothetical protein
VPPGIADREERGICPPSWKCPQLLGILPEEECTARDEARVRIRLKAAGFPVRKTLEEFGCAPWTRW